MVRLSPPRPVKAVVYDVTVHRALDTGYQNTKGRPLLVMVTITCLRKLDGEIARADARIGPTSPANIVVGIFGLSREGTITESAEVINACIVFAVPSGYHYGIVSDADGTASVSLNTWIEVEL